MGAKDKLLVSPLPFLQKPLQSNEKTTNLIRSLGLWQAFWAGPASSLCPRSRHSTKPGKRGERETNLPPPAKRKSNEKEKKHARKMRKTKIMKRIANRVLWKVLCVWCPSLYFFFGCCEKAILPPPKKEKKR